MVFAFSKTRQAVSVTKLNRNGKWTDRSTDLSVVLSRREHGRDLGLVCNKSWSVLFIYIGNTPIVVSFYNCLSVLLEFECYKVKLFI